MTIGTNNFEEEMEAMKAMLERFVKESEEKEARIKVYEEKIARLTKKLEKHLTRSLIKSSESQDEERASKVKLPMRRSTQRRAVNSRTMDVQA